MTTSRPKSCVNAIIVRRLTIAEKILAFFSFYKGSLFRNWFGAFTATGKRLGLTDDLGQMLNDLEKAGYDVQYCRPLLKKRAGHF